MTWSDVGGFLKKIAPRIGGLLTNPVGEGIELITNALAGRLGVENKPEQVMQALQNDPGALLKIKQMETELEALRIKQEMNETDKATAIIQTEASSEDAYVRRTRPKILRDSFALLAVMMVGGFFSMVVMSTSKVPETTINTIMGFWIESMKYLTGLVTAGFLGYVRYRSVHDKRIEKGLEPRSVIGDILKIMKGNNK